MVSSGLIIWCLPLSLLAAASAVDPADEGAVDANCSVADTCPFNSLLQTSMGLVKASLGLPAQKQLNIGFPSSVDLVYLYINGSDPEYQRLRREAWTQVTSTDENKHMTDIPTNDNETVNSTAFSSDSGELLFSLRSISRFLRSKVRKVFLVTESAPVWLNKQVLVSGELEVVHPRTIMPPGTYPNFNSRALESNLHKIPGLGDYYMTLNDDVYLGRPVSFDNFFSHGAPKIHMPFADEGNIDAANTSNDQGHWNSHRQAMKNANRLLDLRFGHRSHREVISHSPLFFSKALVADAHSIFREALDNTSAHIFRSMLDVHPAFLYSHYMRENRSIMAEIEDSEENMIVLPQGASRLCQMVSNGVAELPMYFSVNDHMEQADRLIYDGWIRGGLHTLFPDPSKYEDVSLHHLDEPPPLNMLSELQKPEMMPMQQMRPPVAAQLPQGTMQATMPQGIL